MHVFIDTMTFLHYQDLESIDFRQIFECESVTLVVSRVVIGELDSHKDNHATKRIRDRARRALSLFETAASSGSSIRENVQLEIVLDRPDLSFSEHGLDRTLNDDQLVASIISYQILHPSIEIRVVSNDTGVRLKCKQLSVLAITLPEKYKLPDQSDSRDLEIRRLKRELQIVNSAQPDLKVFFSHNQQTVAEFAIEVVPPASEDVIEQSLKQKREECPAIVKPENTLKLTANALFEISDSEYARYEQERLGYFKEYEEYLRVQQEYPAFLKRTIDFSFEIANVGNRPAEDIDFHVHFPDGFELWEEDDFPELPEPPEPPEPPRSQLDYVRNRTFFSGLDIHRHLDSSAYLPPTSSFTLKKTESYDLNDHFHKIKHGKTKSTPSMRLSFTDSESVKSFHCTYDIHVGNIVDPIEGKLNFVFSTSE